LIKKVKVLLDEHPLVKRFGIAGLAVSVFVFVSTTIMQEEIAYRWNRVVHPAEDVLKIETEDGEKVVYVRSPAYSMNSPPGKLFLIQ